MIVPFEITDHKVNRFQSAHPIHGTILDFNRPQETYILKKDTRLPSAVHEIKNFEAQL